MSMYNELIEGTCYSLGGSILGEFIEQTEVADVDCPLIALKFKKNRSTTIFTDFNCDSKFDTIPCSLVPGYDSLLRARTMSSSSAAAAAPPPSFAPRIRYSVSNSGLSELHRSFSAPESVGASSLSRPLSSRLSSPLRSSTFIGPSRASRPVSDFNDSQIAEAIRRSLTNSTRSSSARSNSVRSNSARSNSARPTSALATTRSNSRSNSRAELLALLDCGICLESFGDGEKDPITIPCGHTFCRDCLSRVFTTQPDGPICPSCRKPIPRLPYERSVVINQIIELFKHPR